MKKFAALLMISLFFPVSAQSSGTVDYPKGEFRNPLGITNYLSGNFGELRNNHFHTGIDIKTNQKEGYRVYAVGDGYVSRVNVSPRGYGNALYIDHPNGYTSVYAHLQGFNAEIEDFVKNYQYENKESVIEAYPAPGQLKITKGDIIALSGNSGGSGGPHLHFEIRDTKTEEPVNPFLFGFDIPDTRAPLINGLYIYPIDGDVVGKKTRHQLPSGLTFNVPVYASGKVGIGIKTYDKQNGAENLNGIYKIDLFVEEEPVYSYTNERLNFDTSRAINSLTDYVDWTQHRGWVYKLFRSEGDPLEMYSNLKNDGYIDLEEGKEYAIRLEVSDYAGNKTTANFKLKGKAAPLPTAADPEIVYLMWNEPNQVEFTGFRAELEPGTIYENVELDYKKTSSGKHHFQSWETPVHKFYTISISPGGLSEAQLEKAIILREYKYRGGWRKEYLPADYQDGMLTAKVRGFGVFSPAADLTKPSLNPVNIKENSTFTGANAKIRFTISDSETGIAGFDAFIDGSWVPAYYDQKTRSLSIDLNREGIGKGKHLLELKVWDEKNNTAEFKANFNKN